MTIKSLLIGSTAALMAVSGARAADAIIADAEPTDYVKVCDAYGTGFFYIPGTETCLRLSGFVRYDINVAGDTVSMGSVAGAAALVSAFNGLDRTDDDALAAFINENFDVLNNLGLYDDSILDGAFSGNVPFIQANELFRILQDATPAEIQAVLGSQAFLSATGIQTLQANGWTKNARGVLNVDARSDTEYGTLRSFIALQGNSGSANNVVIDEAYLSLGGFYAGLRYDYFDGVGIGGENDNSASTQVNAIGYDFSGEGFTAGIMLSDDADTTGAARDFTPNVQGMVGVSFGPADLAVVAGYDNDTEEGLVEATAKFAVAEGVSFDVLGIYASGSTFAWSTSEWSLGASVNATLTDTVAVSVGGQYFGDVGFVDGVDGYTIGANVDWTPVDNFLVRGSVQHAVVDIDGLANIKGTTGYVRFQRSF